MSVKNRAQSKFRGHYFVFHSRDFIAIGGGAAWMFSKRASSLNSSPCLEWLVGKGGSESYLGTSIKTPMDDL